MLNYRIRAKAAVRRLLIVGAAATATVIGGAALAGVVHSEPITAPAFNGSVYTVAYRGDTVYVGGTFTGVSAQGRYFKRARLAAFNARTGSMLDWNPGADDVVRALAVDGGAVYLAGDFTEVDGHERDAIAAVDAVTGAATGLKHDIDGVPRALAVGRGRLYVGGRFTEIDGEPRGNLAAFSTATGELDDRWTPFTDNRVNALTVDGGDVYLGGSFHRTNDVSSTWRLTRVDGVSGVLDRSFTPRPVSQVYGLATDANGIYAALGGQGGRAIAYTRAGQTRWTRVFDGDAQAITALDGITYVGGHFDNACTTTNNGVRGVCADGAVQRVKLAAIDSQGNLLDWAPQANGIVGTRALAQSDTLGAVSAGGDFTSIGGEVRKRYAAFDGVTPLQWTEDAPASPYVAAYNFDTTIADGTFDDGSGKGHLLRAGSRNGGVIGFASHGNGQALVFPAVCAGATCPRLVLQAADTPDLNPGAAPLAFGASVLLGKAEGGAPQNILQKGYAAGGQYKLQVDGGTGKPSCAISDHADPTVHLARSRTSIGDGKWHSLECRRTGPTLTLLVDGVPQATAAVPVALSVITGRPLTVGGKGLGVANDQFHGSLDNLWIRVN